MNPVLPPRIRPVLFFLLLLTEPAAASKPDPDTLRHTASFCDSMAAYCSEKLYSFSEALRWKAEELSIYEENSNEAMCAAVKFDMARLYLSAGIYDKALTCALEARSVFSENRDTDMLTESDNFLGAVYFQCGDYDEAGKYFRKYMDAAAISEDSTKYITALNNMSAWSFISSDTASALRLAHEATALCRNIPDTDLRARTYLNMSSLMINSGHYTEAEAWLDSASSCLTTPEKYGHYWLNRNVISLKDNDTAEAVSFLRKSVNAYSQGEYSLDLLDGYDRLVRILSATGDTAARNASAYAYWQTFERMDIINVYYKMFSYQNEIIRSKEAEKRMERQGLLRMFLTMAVSVVIIAVLIITIYVNRNRLLLEKKEQELRSKNEILEIKNIERMKLESMTEDVLARLSQLKASVKDRDTRDRISGISRDIENTTKDQNFTDGEWSRLVPVFNSEPYKKLIKEFPELTVNERRLCALLSINMSTKEISDITRQSAHSINMARSRLRKKFGLTNRQASIQEFLQKYNNL